MQRKCIAVGNRIMGDDGIAIKVLEEIADRLNRDEITILIGETDAEYIESQINKTDVLLILDATYYGVETGTITYLPLAKAFTQYNYCYGQHQISIFNLLKNKNIFNGFFIGIEIGTIEIGMRLSEALQDKFVHICNEVEKIIKNMVEASYE